jgi:hypothetical protein
MTKGSPEKLMRLRGIRAEFQTSDGPGGQVDILLPYRCENGRRVQRQCLHPGQVQPDLGGEALAAQVPHIANTIDAQQLVVHLRLGMVTKRQLVETGIPVGIDDDCAKHLVARAEDLNLLVGHCFR